MRVAVVGTGISGSLVARRLHEAGCELQVFEAAPVIGGHTATVDVNVGGRRVAVDTGFIVCNERTYPTFLALLRELGVTPVKSDMSFSARIEAAGVEYNGTDTNALFAQRSNLLRPGFWSMVRGILRFYREAPALIAAGDDDPSMTLGQYLARGRYSTPFVEWHLLPMAAAVWSGSENDVRRFPVRTLVRFFANHGFLQVAGRPQWLTIPGGSRTYLDALVAPFRDRILTSTPVRSVRRAADGVYVTTAASARPDAETRRERFDKVVLACHSDQALRLLGEGTSVEREVLGALRYQSNDVVLHTDTRVMPRRARAWAAWNVHVAPRRAGDDAGSPVRVTYWMNRLQPLGAGTPDLFVTLNRTAEIDLRKVLFRATYTHPIFDPAAIAAQRRYEEIDGVGGVHYAGAYWRYGFHEDGAWSAVRCLARLGIGSAVAPTDSARPTESN
jgi:predicted NAD/FAD-binding protein